MTLVAALKMGTRIVVLSDTQIDNRDATRPNIIPGRLKSVVLNEALTVSYAGLSSQAMDAIRSVHRGLPQPTEQVFEALVEASGRHHGELDFILCSHEKPDAPRLVKVSDGLVSEGADFYWIGNQSSASAFSKLELPPVQGSNITEPMSLAEAEFSRRFHEYVYSSRDPNVGGAVVNCLCSPFGHCYQDHAGSMAWDVIVFPDSTDPAEKQGKHKTGITSFSYHVYSAIERGIAIVGLYLEQPEVGFLYAPLEVDDAVQLNASDQAQFRELVTREGRKRIVPTGAG